MKATSLNKKVLRNGESHAKSWTPKILIFDRLELILKSLSDGKSKTANSAVQYCTRILNPDVRGGQRIRSHVKPPEAPSAGQSARLLE